MTTKAKKATETNREATTATKAMLAEFHTGFKKSLAEDQAALEKAPKVHDASKGEYVEEVDPKLVDR